MSNGQWRRGGAAKSIGEILRRMTGEMALSSAARAGDGSAHRVKSFLLRHRDLSHLPPFDAVDRLLVVAGYSDKARNQRLLMAKLWATRLGDRAPAMLAAVLADVVSDGSAASVGACLQFRLRKILAGDPLGGLSGAAPQDLAETLAAAFKNREL